MASNGVTLRGVPQTQQNLSGHHRCSQCGLYLESSTSLQVHMQYHHETMNRWGTSATGSIPSSTTSSTPTSDTENNNQPSLKSHIKTASPHQTIAAAADSSDNQPSTPQPPALPEPGTPQSFTGGASPYQQQGTILAPPEMHYPAYIHGYDPYTYPIDYAHPLQTAHLNNQQQIEYKAVPSSRYHPYSNNSHSNGNHHASAHHSSNSGTHNASPINNAGLSPQVVSSSSSTQNSASLASTTVASSTTTSPQNNSSHIPPTPSPSPIQCEKCGMVCDTDEALNDHEANVHQSQNQQQPESQQSERISMDRNEDQDMQGNYSYGNPSTFIKEEPGPSDILDLDSQKMVYPPEPVLPPMNTLHSLQSIQRHPMMWPHDPHNFMPPHHPHDLKAPYYHPQIKSEYSSTPSIKSDYPQHAAMQVKQEYSSTVAPATIKTDYNITPALPPTVPQSNQSVKPYTEDCEGNQLATSPSDFPSTTTPQENNSQFRNFEPPTSSLPNSALPTKGTAWKSNEARRPKTYNCTACNKWFTSSGHLKRHYNTTLHKNAVKSSGQPDPATLPISVHHHPGRDPNYATKGRRGAAAQIQQPIQQPVPPPDPPRSPDYSTQYSATGFTTPSVHQITSNQGFHQYNSNLQNTSSTVPPNGVAGPSVQASQPRGLQIFSNSSMETLQQQEQLDQTPTITTTTITSIPSPLHSQHTINITAPYPTISPLTINTSIPSFQTILPEAPSYHHIIGNHNAASSANDMIANDHFFPLNGFDTAMTEEISSVAPISSEFPRYPGGAEMYQGDTAPPFSPNVPEQYKQTSTHYSELRIPTPQLAATAPLLSPAPCSPSVSSTGTTLPVETRPSEVHRCDECHKVFNKSCYLTQHNKTFHSGDKPFKCQLCGKRFSCHQSHEGHLAKHNGEKPFKCELCPKQFNHKTDLRRHMCLHSGSKPYVCEECGKGFIRKDHMLKHCETHKKKPSSAGKKAVLEKARLRVQSKVAYVDDE
ncbi:uncharacterized protein LOC128739966 [Sabethes cyaneus]|uniref:uncharacterized protein LOC128739966 n=1 Tax=Sabethes cyaneus TaxID=53552 RepID=UPI00237D9058|nr:uncharacterized protein LOC128739966 [Sabethes cyaneus]